MKKIDYALKNRPKCWENLVKKQIISCLCPSDINLKDMEECNYVDIHFEPCKKCWNEEVEEV